MLIFENQSLFFRSLILRQFFNPITHGGGFFRTPSNFAAFGDPLIVKYIEMFRADFSYLFIYE